VLRTGWISSAGPFVKKFEEDFAAFFGVKHAITLTNGGAALHVALIALGIGPGDEVIVPAFTMAAPWFAVMYTGAKPVFVDCETETWNIDPEKIETKITPKTKAILPVHLYGTGNNMPAIMQIAKNRNLKVLEDCAQAHLAEINGKMVGSFGDIAAFSFYPTKNLGAFGDAGAIVLNDSEIYEKLIALRNLGQKEKNNHIYLGFNNRLDPIQAMALSLKLKRLPALTKEREEAGEYYNRLIEKKGINIKYQKTLPGHSHVYHLYPILLAAGDRSAIQNRLLSQGVETGVYYPVPVYKQPFYKNTIDACPVTDPICENILCLPMYFGITKEEQEYVIDSLKTTLENGK
jgi:dTDP-4-amino-4,6-dideoxygalactose transaminase